MYSPSKMENLTAGLEEDWNSQESLSNFEDSLQSSSVDNHDESIFVDKEGFLINSGNDMRTSDFMSQSHSGIEEAMHNESDWHNGFIDETSTQMVHGLSVQQPARSTPTSPSFGPEPFDLGEYVSPMSRITSEPGYLPKSEMSMRRQALTNRGFYHSNPSAQIPMRHPTAEAGGNPGGRRLHEHNQGNTSSMVEERRLPMSDIERRALYRVSPGSGHVEQKEPGQVYDSMSTASHRRVTTGAPENSFGHSIGFSNEPQPRFPDTDRQAFSNGFRSDGYNDGSTYYNTAQQRGQTRSPYIGHNTLTDPNYSHSSIGPRQNRQFLSSFHNTEFQSLGNGPRPAEYLQERSAASNEGAPVRRNFTPDTGEQQSYAGDAVPANEERDFAAQRTSTPATMLDFGDHGEFDLATLDPANIDPRQFPLFYYSPQEAETAYPPEPRLNPSRDPTNPGDNNNGLDCFYVHHLRLAMKDMTAPTDNSKILATWQRAATSDKDLEIASWSVLAACKRAHKQSNTLVRNTKHARSYNSFADRVGKICTALKLQKTMCKHLLGAHYVDIMVDDPVSASNRIVNNRKVNDGKKQAIVRGRAALKAEADDETKTESPAGNRMSLVRTRNDEISDETDEETQSLHDALDAENETSRPRAKAVKSKKRKNRARDSGDADSADANYHPTSAPSKRVKKDKSQYPIVSVGGTFQIDENPSKTKKVKPEISTPNEHHPYGYIAHDQQYHYDQHMIFGDTVIADNSTVNNWLGENSEQVSELSSINDFDSTSLGDSSGFGSLPSVKDDLSVTGRITRNRGL